MAPYQQRVVDEKNELDSKLARLTGFYDSDTFATLNKEEQSRLQRQGQAMSEYSQILGERIAAFGETI